MKSNDAALIAASAFLCLLGVWCDAGCAQEAEHETLGRAARHVEGVEARGALGNVATKARAAARFAQPDRP